MRTLHLQLESLEIIVDCFDGLTEEYEEGLILSYINNATILYDDDFFESSGYFVTLEDNDEDSEDDG